MAVLKEPRVYLVTRPSVDWARVAQFLEDEGLPTIPESIRAGNEDALAAIEVAARLCYMSFGRGRKDIADFINNLLASKDGSVLEHVCYGFVFTGISRSLSHELVRHRAGFAYSQRSQRYVSENACNFILPPALQNLPSGEQQLEKGLESAMQVYRQLVSELERHSPGGGKLSATDTRKAIRQAARAILPNATETKMFVTANVRAWRHFIEMRASPYADWEIRRLAIAVLSILQEEAPLLFGDFALSTHADGTLIATPTYSKV